MGTTKGALARDLARIEVDRVGTTTLTVDLNDLVDHEFVDAGRRRLLVKAVDPGAPSGREIIGHITRNGLLNGLLPYATDQRTFKVIWLEQQPVAEHQRGY
jgi:hypothetical protein